MGIDEKIHQRASDSIVVPSTWSNILPEDAHKEIIQRKQTSSLTRNSIRAIQITKQTLVDWKRRMNAMTNRIRRAIKGKTQQRGKPSEGGLTVTSPRHPLESSVIIRREGQGGIELHNELGIIVALISHQSCEAKPLHHLDSWNKVLLRLQVS
jgi:hypothetical protein